MGSNMNNSRHSQTHACEEHHPGPSSCCRCTAVLIWSSSRLSHHGRGTGVTRRALDLLVQRRLRLLLPWAYATLYTTLADDLPPRAARIIKASARRMRPAWSLGHSIPGCRIHRVMWSVRIHRSTSAGLICDARGCRC
jgi:hypothetical protein